MKFVVFMQTKQFSGNSMLMSLFLNFCIFACWKELSTA